MTADESGKALDTCVMCKRMFHVASLTVSEQAPWFGKYLCCECHWYVEELAKEIDA
jgi:hypothetical protein